MSWIYVDLVDNDIRDAILQAHGMKPKTNDELPIIRISCPRCHTTNSKDQDLCRHCGKVLSVEALLKIEDQNQKDKEAFRAMQEDVKLLKEVLNVEYGEPSIKAACNPLRKNVKDKLLPNFARKADPQPYPKWMSRDIRKGH